MPKISKQENIKNELKTIVLNTIKKIGLEDFKKTSFFLNNHKGR